MKCLFTNSKILLIEILESFINDKRLMLTYHFVSEVVRFITRIDIKENNKTKRSKDYYVLMGLIFLKIVKMLPKIFECFGDNLNIFQIFSNSYRTTFYSMTLVITFLTFSNFILVKNVNSTKISATDLFIIFLIFLTPQKNFILDLFLFFEPNWFIYLEMLMLFYKYMPFILIFGVFLRYTIRYLGIFTDLKVAFISDGNRRYLRENNLSKEVAKLEGIYKIYEIAIASMNLGIKEVGFYCFSIKNFNRPKSEINSLMNVIESGRSKFNTKNIKIKFKVYGRLNLLKENVRNELVKLMDSTKNNKDITVNLFIAYTTTDELENGIVFNGDVDLIIRTSGEQRLSDFLVRHVAKGTHVFFAKPYWPELTIVQLILILVKYKLEKIFFK